MATAACNRTIRRIEPRNFIFYRQKDLADNFRVADCFRKVPNIRFIEIEDADHMLPLTHSEVLYQEFTAFMED